MGLWTVWRDWGWPLSSIISSMPSMLGRKHTNTLTHLHICWFWLFYSSESLHLLCNQQKCSGGDPGWIPHWQIRKSLYVCICFEMSLGFRRQKKKKKVINWHLFSSFYSWGVSVFFPVCFGLVPVRPGFPLQRNSLSSSTHAHRPFVVRIRQWIFDQ